MHIHYDKEVNLELVDLSAKLVVYKVGALAQQFEGLYYFLLFEYAPITAPCRDTSQPRRARPSTDSRHFLFLIFSLSSTGAFSKLGLYLLPLYITKFTSFLPLQVNGGKHV